MIKLLAATALPILIAASLSVPAGAATTLVDSDGESVTLEAGHKSLKKWLLPANPPHPEDNAPNPARIDLGKKLYFDPRLSGDGNMSCATCHNPSLGWSDGLPTGKGVKSMVLGRASPTIVNTAYNTIQMWDGRKKSLEDQAMGPMEATVEMNMNTAKLFEWLNGNAEYKALFAKAYPGRDINADSVSKAIATYERTAAISNNSPFDRWVKGDAKAMSAQQVEGFALFAGKAKCAVCHSAPNFTDNGFHNLGLPSYGVPEPDMGRYAQKPVKVMRGAFKTPTLRDVTTSAPYFHDGYAKTLAEVVEHYDKGGVIKTDLSPNMQALSLTSAEKTALVAFMQALTSPYQAVSLPELPKP
jgi:cytochrome c peroxidase